MWNTTVFYMVHRWNIHDVGEAVTDDILNYDKIDTSKYVFPNEIWKVKPAWEIIIKLVTIIPIAFFGILGNSSLIYVILRNRSFKTTTNLLVANMAFADLGTLLLCPWMLLCDDFFQNYIFGAIGCHLQGFLTNALTLVAVFSLSAISYDRVSAIVLSYSGKLSQRAVYALICVTWLVGVTVAAPLAFLRRYQTRQWLDFEELYCTEDRDHLTSYWSIFVGISVCAPLAIMAVCYSVILIQLDKYETLALKSKHPIAVKYKGKVATMLSLVVLVFIICRVPFTVFIMQRRKLLQGIAAPEFMKAMQQLCLYLTQSIIGIILLQAFMHRFASRYLLLFNAAIDPVLYGCTSSSLRQALSLCPTIAWILRKRKINFGQRCGANWQSMPNKCGILVPRSPCLSPDNQQEPLPNISSNFKPTNYSPNILHTVNKI